MNKARSVMGPVIGATLLTFVTAAAALLLMMFSTDGNQTVRRETLFGSLFFETTDIGGGALSIEAGVANPTALIVLFFVLAIVLGFVQFIYRGLKQRREFLLNEAASGNRAG